MEKRSSSSKKLERGASKQQQESCRGKPSWRQAKRRGESTRLGNSHNQQSAIHVILISYAQRNLPAFCNRLGWIRLAPCSFFQAAPVVSSRCQRLPLGPCSTSSGLRWKSFEAHRISHFFVFRCSWAAFIQRIDFFLTTFFSSKHIPLKYSKQEEQDQF